MSTTSPAENQAQTHKQRPELHVTAELGVLEAPAGAVLADGNIHVFHQFRPRANEGARWAHQVASEVPYDWDVCDDVLIPEGDELDVLAGSTVPLNADPACAPEHEHAVELFFVTSSADGTSNDNGELLGNRIHHGARGKRRFTVQRALVPDLSELLDVSDDPTPADPRVERLGPIEIDDSKYPLPGDLVTPSVIWHRDSWLMVALALDGETGAKIVKLRSSDRQHWRVEGALELSGNAELPSGRPFAPRIITLTDDATGERKDVLFITYAGDEGTDSHEVVGYVVGNLGGAHFEVTTPWTTFDFGHDFTRPRVVQADNPVIFGLVGAHPGHEGQWANCLSSPRFLSLVDGHLYQDIVGTPRAVKGYSDRALIWTGQLDTGKGEVSVDVLDKEGERIVRVSHDATSVTVTRGDNDSATATLQETDDSYTLTIFVDGPVCEVFVDGGATSLTSAVPAHRRVNDVDVTVSGGAEIINSMVTVGQDLLRSRAGLDAPEEQERFMAEALVADREVAEGLVDEDA